MESSSQQPGESNFSDTAGSPSDSTVKDPHPSSNDLPNTNTLPLSSNESLAPNGVSDTTNLFPPGPTHNYPLTRPSMIRSSSLTTSLPSMTRNPSSSLTPFYPVNQSIAFTATPLSGSNTNTPSSMNNSNNNNLLVNDWRSAVAIEERLGMRNRFQQAYEKECTNYQTLLDTVCALQEELVFASAASRVNYFKTACEWDSRVKVKQQQLKGRLHLVYANDNSSNSNNQNNNNNNNNNNNINNSTGNNNSSKPQTPNINNVIPPTPPPPPSDNPFKNEGSINNNNNNMDHTSIVSNQKNEKDSNQLISAEKEKTTKKRKSGNHNNEVTNNGSANVQAVSTKSIQSPQAGKKSKAAQSR